MLCRPAIALFMSCIQFAHLGRYLQSLDVVLALWCSVDWIMRVRRFWLGQQTAAARTNAIAGIDS